MKKLGLLDVLEGLEDSRRALSVQYPLHEVLFILLVAIICGATSYVKVELFARNREQWLRKYIRLENGIPDACTIRYIVMHIDTRQLHTVFVEWMKNALESIGGVVAIDGKQARRTKDQNKRPLHVVSAFASETRMVLGQLACEEKSNEITAIPQLLETLEIAGCIVTIDAAGTQTEIAKKIRDRGADYVLALKANQTSLYEDVVLYFKEYMNEPASRNETHYAKTCDKGHGRIETRECFTCEDIDWLEGRERWAGLNGIGVIRSKVEKGGITTESLNYFIYSCSGLTARQLMDAKRQHWGIENGLHWVLDMQFREDESRARKDNSAENLNVLRHMAYNVLKSDTSVKGSFSDKQYKCVLSTDYLDSVLKKWFCS